MKELPVALDVTLDTVGVVGAGVIGATVIQDLAQTGHRVVMVEKDEFALAQARRRVASAIRFHHLVAGGEKQNVADVMSLITGTTDYTLLADVDYIIENVTEDPGIKRDVYERLDAVCAPDCVMAANTSVIPITTIGSYTRRPENVVGIHFMNPVPLKSAVELIRGQHTSDRAVQVTEALLHQMNKRAISVADSPGFVSNRVLMLTINEAAMLVEEGVAGARDVDDVFKSCFGHKMGPLETADLIGLDTIVLSLQELEKFFADDKYRPSDQLLGMVDAGTLGRKSGEGFYSYPTAAPPREDGS